MTKFKKYLRAKGIKLECDYEFLPYDYIEAVKTRVLDDCVVVIYYYNCTSPEYMVYDRHGEHGWYDLYDDGDFIERSNISSEYIDFLRDMGYIDSGWALAVMRNVYEDHAKIRIAFKHMKAGIMDEKTFCKLALRYRFY